MNSTIRVHRTHTLQWMAMLIVAAFCLAGTPGRPGLLPNALAVLEDNDIGGGYRNASCDISPITGLCVASAQCRLIGTSHLQCSTCEERPGWEKLSGTANCACYRKVKTEVPPAFDWDQDGNLDPWTSTTCRNAGGYFSGGKCYMLEVPGKTKQTCTQGSWYGGKCFVKGCNWF